jgi:hypothetical protein
MKRLLLALVAVAALAGCANGGGSPATPQPPAGQAAASTEPSAPAAQSSAAAVSGGTGVSSAALRCPSLADVKAATGFTDMTQADVAREAGVVICSYAPRDNTPPVKQMEVVVSFANVTFAQARQDDVKQGLKVTDAPQFGSGAFIATGTDTLYGTVCGLQTKSGDGATIAATADGDLTLQEACTAAERAVPLFQS